MIKIELNDKRTPIAAFPADEVRLVRDCVQYREVYLRSRKNAYQVVQDLDAVLNAIKSDLGTFQEHGQGAPAGGGGGGDLGGGGGGAGEMTIEIG